ncbi:group I intron-associated PD-(D/E)XK endonuclease [Halopiger goleimassiliensis]|uniref:group I intron-associated PD-(D/E)XK endonuclease n=1 Tax=Halopiger goleimassiliensis TaxID=1293048 RepID=UPI000677EEC4|nr:group I intron-associated PD-(D/E)XK endonuclease [Halopiger goleimassiliensis]
MQNSKAIGDETEAKAIATLVEAGYTVSVPFGDNDKYDLVVDDGTLYRIQCKTAWPNKAETIRFNTHSQTTRNGSYYEQTYQGTIDAFFVRDPATETFYWIDAADATEQKMELRFDGEIDHHSINWARDYEFTGEIP